MSSIGIDSSKVSSLRDFGGDAAFSVRRLKPTVNKVLSLRDMPLQKRSMPDIVKIGMTNRDTIDARMKVFFNTSVQLPFESKYVCKESDCEKVKNIFHIAFHPYRLQAQREFLKINPEQAIVIPFGAQVQQGRYFINRRCNLRTANYYHSPKSRRDDTCR